MGRVNMIRLEAGDFGWDYLIVNTDNSDDILVQVDWDYPAWATAFGWSPCHGETDGTVDCPICGKSASSMLVEAQEYLDAHIGDEVEDPGYFEGTTPNE